MGPIFEPVSRTSQTNMLGISLFVALTAFTAPSSPLMAVSSASSMAPVRAPESAMLFGKKAAAPKKVAKKAPKKVAKKAAPPSNRKFFTNDKATKSYGVETPAISLYNLFGGAAAPRDRDLENLANPYVRATSLSSSNFECLLSHTH